MEGETHWLLREMEKEKPCDICGAVGFGELIMVCEKCGTAREHIYCMKLDNRDILEVHEEWICEDCIPDKDRCDGKKNFQNSSGTVHHDVAMQGCPTKAYNDPREHSHSKRQKPVVAGKVKFLSSEEVIRLSSEAGREGFPAKSNLGCGPGYSSGTPKFSSLTVKSNTRISSSGFRKPPEHGRIQFVPITSQQASRIPKDQKATANLVNEHSCKIGFSSVKESNCRNQKIVSIASAKEFKTCNANMLANAVKHCNANVIAEEVKTCNRNAEEAVNRTSATFSTSLYHSRIAEEMAVVAATEGHFCKEANSFITAKEVETAYMDTKTSNKASCTPPPSRLYPLTYGRDPYPVAESKKPDVEDSTNVLPKLHMYLRYSPALCATWKGGFKFFDTTTTGKFYGGFQAQPPCRVNRKANEFSKTMPTILHVNLLPQHRVLADLFQNDYPDFHDIALYFLPSTIERSKENHSCLFELLEIQNSVMRCYINDVELTIFTSKQLHTDLQNVIEMSSSGPFLWGVFRYGKMIQFLQMPA